MKPVKVVSSRKSASAAAETAKIVAAELPRRTVVVHAQPKEKEGGGWLPYVFAGTGLVVLGIWWWTRPSAAAKVEQARTLAIDLPSTERVAAERQAALHLEAEEHKAEIPAAMVADTEQVQATLRVEPEPEPEPEPEARPEPSVQIKRVRGRAVRFD